MKVSGEDRGGKRGGGMGKEGEGVDKEGGDISLLTLYLRLLTLSISHSHFLLLPPPLAFPSHLY